uniref:E3 n=1 Tax=Bat mastadenovirus TaxID=740971 RepID=A0A8G0RD97_9ADEN|nr:E3 [Bat mastadenovirus]
MVPPEMKLEMQEAQRFAQQYWLHHKMEDSANFELWAICWGLGLFFFFCLLMMYCYYRYRVGKMQALFGSGVFLIGEAKAEEGETLIQQVCELDWWEWATVILVAVAAVCTVAVLAYVCWKYPPSCKRKKGWWLTAPLLLLFVAAPASQGVEVQFAHKMQYFVAETGEDVWFHPSYNFTTLVWEKYTWNATYEVAAVNETAVEINYRDRNYTGIGRIGIYINGSLLLSNLTRAANGNYAATYNGSNTTEEFFYLYVNYHVQAPEITVHKLNTTGCTLLCRCAGENTTFEAIKGNYTWQLNNTVLLHPDDVRHLRCTSWRKTISRSRLVSVQEVCTPHYVVQIVYAHDFWWFVLAVVLIVIACHLWFHREAIRFNRRRAFLFTPLALLMIAAPAQAKDCFDTNMTFVEATVGSNVNLTLPFKPVDPFDWTFFPNLSTMIPQPFVRVNGSSYSILNIYDYFCSGVTVDQNSIQMLNITELVTKFRVKALNDHPFEHWFFINFNEASTSAPMTTESSTFVSTAPLTKPEPRSLIQPSSYENTYWKQYWWVYLVTCLVLFLMILMCVICSHKIRARRSMWALGPILLLMIADVNGTRFNVPDLSDQNLKCAQSGTTFLKYTAVNITLGDQIILKIQCLQNIKEAKWHININNINLLFFMYENGKVTFINEQLLYFCQNPLFSENTFQCQVISDIQLITTSVKNTTHESLEMFYFNYGNTFPTQEIYAAQGQKVVLHCFVSDTWMSYEANRIIWYHEKKIIGVAYQTELVDYFLNRTVPTHNTFVVTQHNQSLVIKNIKKENYGNYTCKASTTPKAGVNSIHKFYYYVLKESKSTKIETKTPTEKTVQRLPELQVKLIQTKVTAWWMVLLIVFGFLTVILFMIWGILTIKKSAKITKIACLSPLILAVCIPPTSAENIIAIEHENVLLGRAQDFEALQWSKCENEICANKLVFAKITTEGAVKLTQNFPTLGLSVVDVFINGSINIKNVQVKATGIYMQETFLSAGETIAERFNISVLPQSATVVFEPKNRATVKLMEHENLFLINPYPNATLIQWYKCGSSCSQTKALAIVKNNNITMFPRSIKQIGVEQVDVMTNGNMVFEKVTLNTTCQYEIRLEFKDGNGFVLDFTVSVTADFKKEKIISAEPTPQVITIPAYSELRETWWVILLIILTFLVFIGIGVKVYLTDEIGIPESTYPQKKGLTNPLLITIACLCLLLPAPTQGKHECQPDRHHYHLLSNHSALLNVSIDVSIVKKFTWGRSFNKTEGQLILEYDDANIHYFKREFGQLMTNGSLFIYNVSKSMEGVYKLVCTKENREINEATVIVNVTDPCLPPKMLVSASVYEEPFKGTCRATVSCFSPNSNGVKFVPSTPGVNFTAYYQSASYWLYPNSTAPVYATCNCTNRFGAAYTQVELRRECAEATVAHHLLIHPITYVSMHHLWWIIGLMIFLGGLIVAAYWWWTKHHPQKLNAPHGLSDPEKPTAPLKDPAEIV